MGFCPNCRKITNEEAKFCMNCGTKLGNFENAADIMDHILQRPKARTSIKKPEINSPNIFLDHKKKNDCPKCGSQLKKRSGFISGSTVVNGNKIEYAIALNEQYRDEYSTAFVCPNCQYKCISSGYRINNASGQGCPCGGEFIIKVKGVIKKLRFYECSNCGHREESTISHVWKNALSAKELLINAGWVVLE